MYQMWGPQYPKFEYPARDSKCNKCHKKGHWSKVCTSTQPPRRQVQEITNNSDLEIFFGEVVDSINVTMGELKAVLQVNENSLGFTCTSSKT